MRIAAAVVLCAMAQEGEVYVYRQTDLSTGKPCDERLVVLSCELKSGIACRSPRDIPIVLLFTLPEKRVVKGQSWDYERDFFTAPSLTGTQVKIVVPRVRVRGKLKAIEVIDNAVTITGSFSVFEEHERKEPWAPDERRAVATIETQQVVDVSKALLMSATYSLTGTIRENASAPLDIWERPVQVRIARRIERAEKETSAEEAIKRGREWLAKQQQADGHFAGKAAGCWMVMTAVGPTAMAIMALVHSGMRADDPVVRRAWEFVKLKAATMPREVYDVSLALLALGARYSEKNLSAEDRSFLDQWAAWLVDSQLKAIPPAASQPHWGFTNWDLIKAQHAAVALRAATRLGYKVPASAWKFILRRFARVPYGGEKVVELGIEGRDLGVEKGADGWKTEPGSWGYFTLRGDGLLKELTGNSPLTCAALAIVKICESELKAMGELEDVDRKRAHDALRQGFAWLQTHWSVRAALPEAGSWSVWHLYYLWSLERAATLCGIKKIGGHDWYKEGEAYLLATQRPDGSWNSPADVPTVDTAFALLFLRRPGTATKGDK